jgi:creatinine amidohydrolase
MRVADLNWMQMEEYLGRDDRAIVPIGSTEQHAYLSLAVDSILSERVALEAAEPLGIPVFPVLPYGITPTFLAFPGTISLRVETFVRVIHDILDSLDQAGFRRILVVNGHGGNQPASSAIAEWMSKTSRTTIRLHNWWNAPKTLAFVQGIDPTSSHASWMENLPWTRLADVPMPDLRKPAVDYPLYSALHPKAARAYVGDGNFGGDYQRSDAEVGAMWDIAVKETRAMLEGPWGRDSTIRTNLPS